MSDLKNWCYLNDVEWHTTSLESLKNKTALEKLWEEKDDEIASLKQQLTERDAKYKGAIEVHDIEIQIATDILQKTIKDKDVEIGKLNNQLNEYHDNQIDLVELLERPKSIRLIETAR